MAGLDVLQALNYLIAMIFALTVHEYFHAWTALKLGDDTAKRQGRLTLNPIAHLDPIGTLLLPMVGMLSGVPFFGWAKPVPISPIQFTRRFRMKTGVLLTSAAGPLSNIAFAVVIAVLLGLAILVIGRDEFFYQLQEAQGGVLKALFELSMATLQINIGLFFFNLIPVPPLDGSGVLAGFLPDRYQHVMDSLSQYSFLLFIGILWFGGSLLGAPVRYVSNLLLQLVGLIAG